MAQETLKKKRYAMESLKVDGEILGSGFSNSSLLSTCPSFKTFIENLPNLGFQRRMTSHCHVLMLFVIRAYIIELLQTEERSYLWYKVVQDLSLKRIVPKVESCLEILDIPIFGEAFERNRGSEINVTNHL